MNNVNNSPITRRSKASDPNVLASQLAEKAQQMDFLSHLMDVVPHDDFLLYDSFGRSDSATSIGNVETNGNAYTIISTNSDHVWGISGNQAYTASGTANTRGMAYQETNEWNVVAEVNISGVSSITCGIAFRIVDLNNFWFFSLTNSTTYITKYVSGTSTQVGQISVGGATQGKLTVITNNNKIECYFNDILIYETYDSFNNTATKHGLYTRIDTNVKYDNFSIKKISKKKQYQYSINGLTNPLPWIASLANASKSYSFTYNSTNQDNGINSLRFELDYGDPDSNAGGKRSEISMQPEKPLNEYWYSLDVYLPNGGSEDYGNDTSAEIITQWHNLPDSGEDTTLSPPLSLRTQNGRYQLYRIWDDQQFSYGTGANSWQTKGNYESIDLGDYSSDKGKWVNWTYHVKWGWLANQNPILEVYKNGILVVNRNGKPNTYNDKSGVYFKFGVYKWDWSTAPTNVSKRVIYFNNILVK